MSSAPQVSGVEMRAQWREGYEQVLDDTDHARLGAWQMEDEELAKVGEQVEKDAFTSGKYAEARELFEQVALRDDFVVLLTLPAYERIG